MNKLILVALVSLTLSACGGFPEGVTKTNMSPVQIIKLDGKGYKPTILERYCDGTTGISIVKIGGSGKAGGISETLNAPYCQ